MGHAGKANELLEVFGDELRAVVADDARLDAGVELSGALDNALDVGLGHGLPNLPVHDVPAGSVENRAHVVEGPAEVEVGDVDVPVLMGA